MADKIVKRKDLQSFENRLGDFIQKHVEVAVSSALDNNVIKSVEGLSNNDITNKLDKIENIQNAEVEFHRKARIEKNLARAFVMVVVILSVFGVVDLKDEILNLSQTLLSIIY